jgi:hypothetical protein
LGQFTSGGAGGAGRSAGTKDFLDTTDIESDMGGGAKGFLDTTDIEPDMGTGAKRKKK